MHGMPNREHEPDTHHDDDGSGRSGRRRRRALVGTVLVSVLLAGGGFAAAQFIKSPGQKAAEADAPAPSVISAVVESRRLADTVVLRGRVSAAQSVEASPLGAGASTGGDSGGGKPVVTGIRVKAGDALASGQVLLEVSGRPVFVLAGEVPVYRDLKPGAEGRDVEQLQKALAGMGFSSGSDKAGVFGAETRKAVGDFYARIGYEPPKSPDAGEEQVRGAQDAVTQAERAVKAAKDALAAAKAAAKPPATPAGSPSGSASGAPSGAPSGGPSAGTPPASSTTPPRPGEGSPGAPGAPGSGDGVKQAQQQLTYANEDLARAKAVLTDLQAKQGAMVPASEVVFLRGFPGRVDSVGVAVGGEVREKAVVISAGALVVKGALAPHEKGLVRPGMRVKVLSELSGIEAEAAVTSVADAPTSESTENAGQGAQVPSGGRTFEMVVTPTAPLDPKLAGQDVRLTVEAASSDGEVLVVPLSAVSAGADGRTVVTVLGQGGRQDRVEVRPGTTGDGYVQVTPVGGALNPGDRVVVGVKRGSGASDGSSDGASGGASGGVPGGVPGSVSGGVR